MKSLQTCAVLALALTAPAFAGSPQNTRTFVSTGGDDGSPCLVNTPCRSLAAALAVTAPNGEVVIVTSGGYGPFSITKPVTISAVGVSASVIATDTPAITINTSGNVTIVGLALHGQGKPDAQFGIDVTQVGYLHLYNVTMDGFSLDGMKFNSTGTLAIYNSRFTDNTFYGLEINAGNVQIHNTAIENNGLAGVNNEGHMTLADSQINGNVIGLLNSGTLVLIRDEILLNGTSISSSAGAVNLSYCLLAQNTTAFSGTIKGTAPATNLILDAETVGSTSTLQ
jgi:hypothetical protein